MNLRPLGDRVIIKPKEQEERTKSGVILPDTATKERPMQGEVIAVGPGRQDDSGKITPMSVKEGDQVIFAKYAGAEVKLEDEEFLILSEKDILGIVLET